MISSNAKSRPASSSFTACGAPFLSTVRGLYSSDDDNDDGALGGGRNFTVTLDGSMFHCADDADDDVDAGGKGA